MIIAAIVVVWIPLLGRGAFSFPVVDASRSGGLIERCGAGQRTAGKAPGPALGDLRLQKPFGTSRKATNKSAAEGRRGRSKLPPARAASSGRRV